MPERAGEELARVHAQALQEVHRLLATSEHDDDIVDIEQLGSGLSFILVDKAKIGSDILLRIQNMQTRGGLRMYAEVYKWFSETSASVSWSRPPS